MDHGAQCIRLPSRTFILLVALDSGPEELYDNHTIGNSMDQCSMAHPDAPASQDQDRTPNPVN